MQIVTFELPDDINTSCVDLTRLGFAEYLFQLIHIRPKHTSVILRVPDNLAPGVRATLGWTNPENPEPYELSVDKRWVPPKNRTPV